MNDLECLDVSKNFGSLRAVDHVSFEVARGSFFSILGPSGCGKTTLMRMIAGFETPSTGDIRIKGKSVLSLAPNRRNVKMVFQHLALFPMMNVGENIAYGLRCQGVGKAEIATRVQAVLDRVSLPDAADKEIHQLSGGQRQRIAIARCMVLEPDVLLLDEPLGALDLKLRERMKIELKLLQHQFDTTFLYITHDQSEALVMSDQVAVMNAGRFEQVGAPHELYHNPRSGFVAGFVGDSNRWPCRVLEVRGDEARVEIAGVGTMTARCDQTALAGGDQAELFVRPEAISLADNDVGDGRNRLSGVVDSLLFNGANSRILVRMSKQTGDMVEVDFPNLDSQATIRAGDEVHLSWPASRARCFATASAST